MVRGRHVYGSCIIHECKEVGKRGLKMTLVVGRGLSSSLYHLGQHNVHIICSEYNVITTTCRVCRMQPWSEWPSVHAFRLRQANLRPSLQPGSRAYDPPNPVALPWRYSHSGVVVVGHRTIRWLCSMARRHTGDEHSRRNTNSSFKQIEAIGLPFNVMRL